MDDKKKAKLIVAGAVVAAIVYCAGYSAGQKNVFDTLSKVKVTVSHF